MSSNFKPQILGVVNDVTPTGDQTAHVCPKCKKASVYSSKSTTQVVVLFVAIGTTASESSWLCTTEGCGWKAPLAQDPSTWEPKKEKTDKLVDI
ncbi:Cytochrome c heme-binding site [Mycena chlorophos]|uniref:Cytochrome c heme-binding site n=1 Tax=Mycena chlorophos TaxID=658473 RepID=A0A8H6WLK8_MYCCL|nr:Cytochrome c heme-binding site [Mycena chlorophos]